MKLSQNFTLEELTRSGIAMRRGIDNTPGPVEIAALELLVSEVLQPVRSHYGIPFTPSSGYRGLELNRAVGSKDTSQHVKGQAADFEIPGIPNRQVAEWIISHCKFDQLLLEYYTGGNTGWIHVSALEEDNRGEALIFNGKTYTAL